MRALRIVFWAWFVLANLLAMGLAIHEVWRDGATESPYQLWWAGLFGAIVVAAAFAIVRGPGTFRVRRPGLVFAIASLGFVLAEELTCLALHSGAFEHTSATPVAVVFVVVTLVLWICALGGFAAYRVLRLSWLDELLLYSFAGGLLETLVFSRDEPLAIRLGLIVPIGAWHYALIGMIPLLLVRDAVERMPRWNHPAKWILGIVIPLAIPTAFKLAIH